MAFGRLTVSFWFSPVLFIFSFYLKSLKSSLQENGLHAILSCHRNKKMLV